MHFFEHSKSMPVDTGAVEIHMVCDIDYESLYEQSSVRSTIPTKNPRITATHISPASLNPRPRVGSVEQFRICEVEAVRVDPAITNVQGVMAVYAFGRYIFLL